MRRRILLVMVATALTVATRASADTFVLLAPSAVDLDFEGNGFFFVADGFRAQQSFDSTVGFLFGGTFSGCDPCRPGDVYDTTYVTTNAAMGHGPASLGSTSWADLTYFGDLSFQATPVLFPSTTDDLVRMQTPFVFTGALRGFDGNQLAFSVNLTGSGTSFRTFDRNEPTDLFFAGENRLSFGFNDPAAAATPEPASLLLLGTGLAGVVARRRLTADSRAR